MDVGCHRGEKIEDVYKTALLIFFYFLNEFCVRPDLNKPKQVKFQRDQFPTRYFHLPQWLSTLPVLIVSPDVPGVFTIASSSARAMQDTRSRQASVIEFLNDQHKKNIFSGNYRNNLLELDHRFSKCVIRPFLAYGLCLRPHPVG